jgi:hypothetical protein
MFHSSEESAIASFYLDKYIVTIIEPISLVRKTFRIFGYRDMQKLFNYYTINFCQYYPEGFYSGDLRIDPTIPAYMYFWQRGRIATTDHEITVVMSSKVIPVYQVPVQLSFDDEN